MKKLFFLLILGLGLSSCINLQELTRSSCQETRWNEQGERDALQGKKYNQASLQKCEAAGVKVDKEGYLNGYTEGAKRFCTYEYGLKFAREGKEYHGSCPTSLESAFLSGYNQGKLEKDRLDLQKQQLDIISNAVNTNHDPYSKMSCSFDSDCVKKDICDFKAGTRTCRLSKKSCTFDSDCEVKGVCDHSYCRWK